MKQLFYFLTIFTLCFGLFCCNNKKQDSTLYNITQNVDYEDFDKFIKEFSADKNFQFGHINFPVEMFVPANEKYNIKDTTLYIHKSDWKIINLTDAGKFPSKGEVSFTKMQYENGFAIVVKGINYGIYITYFFEKQKEKNTWFLVKIEDTSM
ncbi:MAG: hypothetical protein FWD66_05475 [Paludibacter sp.]|nr:hypothetical protein [Paludibacter sp.]